MSQQVAFNRVKLVVGTVMFIILFGFVRNIVLDIPLNSDILVITTILFIIWQGLSDQLTTAMVGSPSFSVNDSYSPPIAPTCP